MSAAAEILYDISPDMHFEPADELLIELYLLRRVRGQPDLFPGLIVDDDTAANTQPWELFGRHGLPIKDGARAFFFVHTNGGARPDRRCQDGGTWKSQKRLREDLAHEMVVDGEKIKWSRHNLNFHMDMESGSKGWVMHEYTITTNPSLKLCRISYSGYGQKRKCVPDGYGNNEPVTQRPRVAAEEISGSATSGSGTMAFDQGFSTAHASEDGELLHNSSDAAMLAEMTNWEFQAEQVQTMNTSAPQELPSSSGSTTTMLSQESGLAQDSEGPLTLLSDDDMAEVLDIIAEPPADGEPYQQVPVMDQSSCGVPTNIGDANIVHWEGFDLDLSFF
ncbi:hypothetical protein EJB05_24156, partial [Eragrostis curvula]